MAGRTLPDSTVGQRLDELDPLVGGGPRRFSLLVGKF